MRSRSSTVSSTSSCVSSKNIKEIANNAMMSVEKNIIEEFALKIYLDGLINSNGLIAKTKVWREFKEFDKAKEHKGYFADKNIGTLLRKHKLLLNTERGSGLYCIWLKSVFAYRNSKLKELDESHMMGKSALEAASLIYGGNGDVTIEENVEISPDAEEFPVVFKGGFQQTVKPNFTSTNSSCFICQKNFQSETAFEEHIEFHGFESDFEFLSSPGKKCENIFEIIYRLVNKSHNFYFTMKTDKRDIIIEKIILIKANVMHFIKNSLLPYEIASDGIDSFLVDSHMFTLGAEQPIVVIYRNKSDKTIRYVEEHHFLRTEEFPQVHFNIRSYRIPSHDIMKIKFKLGEYKPNKLKAAKEQNFSNEALGNISTVFRNFFLDEERLNEKNVIEVLTTLIQIEDISSMNAYAQLRQKRVKIKRFGQEYSVKLQRLPKELFLENILSPLDECHLVAADEEDEYVRMINSGGRRRKRPKVTRAIIEGIYYNSVCFRIDNRGALCDTKAYNVSFHPSRLGLRYQYRALEMLSCNISIKRYLHPLQQNFNLNTSLPNRHLDLFNPSIESNIEQIQAVQNIVDGPSSFAPYIIFGPPGTGKTSTIVEAVLQLWKERPDTQILITAGSNAACDEVAIRLCRILTDLQPGERNILRIFSKSNEKRLDSIDDLLIECSNFYRGHFYPSANVIREFRIVVCTLSVVGKLVLGGIGSDFFTHIFIDECAASTEPESLVGIMGTASMKTRVILAGDHKQLGPILKSTRANDLGLKVSLMERLLNLDCYSVNGNGDYDRTIQSRLVRNFRSHPKIVQLFSDLYYGGTLKPIANDDDVDLCSKWHRMPNKEYPIVFHAVYGSSHHNGRSVSLCNEREVETVIDYVKDLMYFGINGCEISETDIGIISPYKRQYLRIQEELNRRRWFQIEVGAVETFQGKEKRIIIVSTVRSFTKTLGFLDNPRRLNVILSRPQSLLVIIGNPNTLSMNNDYKYIIEECRKNNSALGSFRDFDKVEVETNKMEKKEITSDGLSKMIENLAKTIKEDCSIKQKDTINHQTKKTESKDKDCEHAKIDLKKEFSYHYTTTNGLRKGDFFEKVQEKTQDLDGKAAGQLRKEDFYEKPQDLYGKAAGQLRKEDFYEKPQDLYGKAIHLRKQDFYEKAEPLRFSKCCEMNSIQTNLNNLTIKEKLKNERTFNENHFKKVEPVKVNKPMYSYTVSNDRGSPSSRNSSEYLLNTFENIKEYDRKYERIVSLPFPDSKKSEKKSKCVLC